MADYQLRQREYLLAISRAMTARLDLPSLLKLILESAAEMLGAQTGLLAVREPDGSFRVRASYGVTVALLELFAPLLKDIPIQGAPVSWMQWQIPDLPARLRRISQAAGIPLGQMIYLPLVLEERLVGVLFVFRLTNLAFSANDRQVLASFADQAAIAIHNASLYQQALAEKRRLDAIIEHSADGVMILDRECRIEVFNRALARMSGWRAAETIGQPCAAVLHLKNALGQEVCGELCPMVRQYEEGQDLPGYVEGDLTRSDGLRVSVGVTHALLRDVEGRLLNVIVNVHDITRFREAEELKSTFISVISHELKTPVALIKGYASTLRREDAHWDSATMHESLGIIEQESDRLNSLINNLLDASRIEAGGLKVEPTDLALPRLVERVVEKFRTQTQEHQFQVDFPPDFPPVFADEERISQVLYNLLSNAIKYSPKGGLIRVGGWAQGREAAIYVSDEGIGIPEEDQAHLFERFYRVDSSLRRRTQGAGLGLFLCRAIVEAHGGRIWVRSQAGQGSTFYFTLPQAADDGGEGA